MMNKKEFIDSQKDCADMLGVSLEKYQKSIENIKVPTKTKNNSERIFDNSILDKLGLKNADLKNRKVI